MMDENNNTLVNKLVTTAIVGLLSWNVWTTQKLAVDVAVVKSTLSFSFEDSYNKSEAVAEHRLLESRITHLENQMEDFRSKLNERGKN